MHVIEAFSCASLNFDLFWTNSCCEDAVKKHSLGLKLNTVRHSNDFNTLIKWKLC